MFEAISQSSKVQNTGELERTSEPLKPAEEEVSEPKRQEVEQENKKGEISQVFLDELEKDIEMIQNVGLRFSIHKPTGRTVIKVIDKETQELVREIPSEDILNLASKLDEMIGMIFDKSV